MKILIAIHLGFNPPYGDGRAGGSETWALTMADQFQKMGHVVLLADSRDNMRMFEGLDLALTRGRGLLDQVRAGRC